MNRLQSEIAANMLFVAEFAALVFAVFLIAYLTEKKLCIRRGGRERILSTGKVAVIGIFSAVSAFLMLIEIPVPFAPPFYKIDLSELPILIISFAYGPVAGVMTEWIKILLKLVLKSTSTAFVGELANFLVGCSLVLPAGVIYLEKKTRRMAVAACLVGILCMTVFGSALNAVYLLPKFAELYGVPLEALIELGSGINPAITGVETMALFAVAPLNLLKGSLVSLLTALLYKRLSPVLKSCGRRR